MHQPLTLYCLPYAGGSATMIYSRWRQRAPSWLQIVPLELPGRGHRIRESLHSRMGPLVRQLVDELVKAGLPRYALFGHSLGGLIAFEMAHKLRELGAVAPMLLFISGSDAPNQRADDRYADGLTDLELVEELRSLGGTPAEVLSDAEMLDLILPVLRADLQICGNYRPAKRRQLQMPIHVFGGTRDTPSITNLTGWGDETKGGFSGDMLDGGHFFIRDAEDALLRLLVMRIRAGPKTAIDPRAPAFVVHSGERGADHG